MKKVFKKKISASKMLLCASVCCNLLLAGVVYVEESHSCVFRQALVRRGIGTIEDKQYPDFWARRAWTNTIKKLNIDFDVAFFGNSITCGSDFQQSFPDKKIINLGYPGDNILGMQVRVPMIKESKAKKVFIMAGTNDLVHIDLKEYKKRYTKLISLIQDSIPGINIYIESVLPSNHHMVNSGAPNEKVQEANKIAREIAKEHRCTYIDLYSLYVDKNNEMPQALTKDGIHLYPKSYERWTEKIKPFIYE